MRLDEDTAVIAYTVHEQLEVDGDPVAFDAADTSTWVRRGGPLAVRGSHGVDRRRPVRAGRLSSRGASRRSHSSVAQHVRLAPVLHEFR